MNFNLNSTDNFVNRHIGPDQKELISMLEEIGVSSLDQLIRETIPLSIRTNKDLNIPKAQSEYQFLQKLKAKAQKNKLFKSYIGLGYYGCITPSPILRNIFQNPGWYTQYTPYQAEIAQGRLEALLNFQTVVSDLTALPIANASLLDEATAAAEAMAMLFNVRNKRGIEADTFFVSDKCFPQTIEVLKTRSKPLGIKLVIGDHNTYRFEHNVFGALLQYPAEDGAIFDYTSFIDAAHQAGAYVAIAADLLSLTILTPPGELGADVVVGNTQRFGVPLGFGGPHAAYFATKDEFKRNIPGRIIGVSIDSSDKPALRMALQTREQHIRREKATSNICTAQALLAIMAGMYAVYHGPEGLKRIALRIHQLTKLLAGELTTLGFKQVNAYYFDTLKIDTQNATLFNKIKSKAEENGINFRYIDDQYIGISLDETTQTSDLEDILSIFKDGTVSPIPEYLDNLKVNLPTSLIRKTNYLTNSIFHTNRSETRLMRYIKSLENKDLSLTHSMIPLGSCTMKLNAATELIPVSWPEFADLHPFVSEWQTEGYSEIINELATYLNEITGFSATSFQPNSGAQGEYAGLMVIRAYQADIGEAQRDVVLIPSSAHGTNPASAVMAGLKVVVVNCDESGNIDLDDLKNKAQLHKDRLSALMITYPSTHGVFEQNIKEVCESVHENGGQVYMDGANMNAQVGFTNPAIIGADVCHLNLHKTFSIPHGGGGPGMGPICVAQHLAPFLPGHKLVKTGGENAISSIAAAPYGSSSILLISYAYIKMLGPKGLAQATEYAILNANYIKARLEKYYKVLYQGKNGRVAHELIVDLRAFKYRAGIEVEDVAKRLIDYGFHAPTMSWPVPGTMMIEPTESEDKTELDRFCDALISIKQEIDEIENGSADEQDNVLKNAPHTCFATVNDNWPHSYTREKAAYPLPYLKENKFWPPVGRVNNPYGDRNLICTCPSVETFVEEIKVQA